MDCSFHELMPTEERRDLGYFCRDVCRFYARAYTRHGVSTDLPLCGRHARAYAGLRRQMAALHFGNLAQALGLGRLRRLRA